MKVSLSFPSELPQPKGIPTGGVIAGILCVILLVALIASVIMMVRKRQRKNIDRPPTHKPPPPMKTDSYSDSPSMSKRVSDSQFMHHETDYEEPMTDLSAYNDDKDHHELSRLSSEDKQTPYQDDRDEDGMMGEEGSYYVTSSASRGSSFMSPAVIV